MPSRLMEVLLRVRDIERSVAFYRDILGLTVEPGDEAKSHFEVSWGSWKPNPADLLMFLIYPAHLQHPQSVCEIGFSVGDLEATHAAALRASVPVIAPPSQKPWGRQVTYGDPDGHIVAVAQAP